jgi:hypothetical protein
MKTTRFSLAIVATLVSCALVVGQELAPGLLVRLYDVGEEMSALPELVAGQAPNEAKVVPTLNLKSENKDFGDLESNFMTEVLGQIRIDKPGKYTFRLISDDGSQFWLDGALVIDHDGEHPPTPKDGEITLAAGPHELRVLHFQGGGGARLTLLWKGIEGARDQGIKSPTSAPAEEAGFELIPASLLSHRSDLSMATAPGKKTVIAALRKGRPGDGRPVTKAHPGFEASPDGKATAAQVKDHFLELEAGKPPAWLGPDISPAHLLTQMIPDGVYKDQLLVWDPSGGEGKRIFIDTNPYFMQSCTFRVSTQMAGEHFKPTATPVFEMLAARATKDGVQIQFTKPLDPRVGWDPECFYIEQWPFDLQQGILPHRDGVVYPVKSASVMPDATRIFLEIENLKPSRVLYIRLLPPCLSKDGDLPWSTEAWYTLHVLPPRHGLTIQRPPQEPQNFLTDEERQAGWRLLFDGQTTKGWHGYKKEAFPDGWKVEDGCLVRVGPAGDIATDDEFQDFELSLEWRISAGGNSGIMYRVTEDHDYPWQTGPEYQVLDNSEHADGKNPLTSAASCYALYAPSKDATVPVGFFNQARIVVRGKHVEHWLNGVKVVEYELGSPEWEKLVAASKFGKMPDYGRRPKGKIDLQDHGDKVWYRNIKIREMNK